MLSAEGAKLESCNGQKRGSGHVCMYICNMHVCLYACMFFEVFSRLRALTEPKVVPYDRVLDNILLRHVFSTAVFPARARCVIVVPEAVFRIVGHQAAWVRAVNRAKVFPGPGATPPLRYPIITALRFYLMIQNT